MKKIHPTEKFKKEVYRLTRQAGKLNGYIQNIPLVDEERIILELKGISTQTQYLLKQIKPEIKEEPLLKEE